MSETTPSAETKSRATGRSGSDRALLALSVPILIPMLSQNIRLWVDTILIGRVSPDALAVQGLIGFLSILLLTPLSVLGGPVQALASRAFGRSDGAAAATSLRAAFGAAILGGTLLGAALIFAAPALVGLLIVEPRLEPDGAEYLQAILFCTPFMGVASAFYGYWLAAGRPRINLWVEIATHAINLIFASLLVFGQFGFPRLGLQGAGVAFALSSIAGALLHICVYRRLSLFNVRAWAGDLRSNAQMLSVAWHSLRLSVQSNAAFLAMYLLVQFVGVRELAGFTVLIRLAMTLVYPAQALGRAAASLAGRAIGRGDFEEAQDWAKRAIRLGCIVTAVLGAPCWLFPHAVLQFATGSIDIADVAAAPLRLLGVTIVASGVGFVMLAILSTTGGANRARRSGFVSQWLVQIPAAAIVGPILGLGLLAIWAAQSVARILLAWLLWRQWLAWARGGFALEKG
jgi:MATE family multidrug resistance protein